MTLDRKAAKERCEKIEKWPGKPPYVDEHNGVFSVWQGDWGNRFEHGEFGVGDSGRERAEFYLHGLTDLPAALAELDAKDQRIAELEQWKANEQQYAISCVAEFAKSGLKANGDGLLDCVRVLVARIAELEEPIARYFRVVDEVRKRQAVDGYGQQSDSGRIEGACVLLRAALGGDGKESGNG